jgi:ribosome-binding protein aMBF1 (putative translation factor)
MSCELGAAQMTDSELLSRYRSAESEFERKARDVQQAEADMLARPSQDCLRRMRIARRALRDGSDRRNAYQIEISRRLHAPLRCARLAKGLSQGEAAKRAGWRRGDIKIVEAGTHWVSVEKCVRMWQVLGLALPEDWETLA